MLTGTTGAETRGVFRIPGSVRIVNALYQFYCADRDSDKIASSTCFPNLPSHIQASTHDVASTFKRLLSGLPGGILGSLSLFDAFVAIYSYLKGEPESTATRVTKLRARLIALAIGTVRSHLRRDLICAVFGLLCLIGRVAENTPREDEHGRPLPTTDLMGYSALGIVFGPLLVGDLLSSYTIKNEDPITGPVLEAVTPQPSKEKRWCKSYDNTQKSAPSVDKVLLANNITEMLITHWREVVRHMKGLEISRMSTEKGGHGASREQPWRRYAIRPSITESFMMRGALDHTPSRTLAYTFDNDSSPPGTPTPKPCECKISPQTSSC
jgi:RhoGAP domain.